jgi:aminoglycoside phosphotransferase (APT) family kinase protein
MQASPSALGSTLPGTPLATGGTAEVFALDERRVLKLYWRGASALAPEREAERAWAAHAAGAPCPAVLEVIPVHDRFGVVFERARGQPMLKSMLAEPHRAEALVRDLGRLHAQLHARTCDALPSQREHLGPRIALSPLNHRLRSAILAELARLPDADTLCHGDFHPGNVLLTSRGPCIVDWFDAVRGHPAADVARTLLLLQYARAPRGAALESARKELIGVYLDEYRRLREMPSETLDAWTLPVAAARLAEPIAGAERATLLRLIGSMLATA